MKHLHYSKLEQKMKYLSNKKLPIQLQEKKKKTYSNKLCKINFLNAKLNTSLISSRPLCHQFPMLLFILLARDATIKVSC